MIKYYIILFIIFGLLSCNNENNKQEIITKDTTITESAKVILNNIIIISPLSGETYKIGEKIELLFDLKSSIKIDSVRYVVNGNIVYTGVKIDYKINTDSFRVGLNKIKVRCFYDGKSESKKSLITLKSDITPKPLKYKLINTYAHDIKAYTQGLVYENGFLYEGTGQWGESTLRKVKPETSELIQSYNLPNNVFGEGVVIVGDKIIQLTWQSKTAYRYNKNTFSLINTFNYQTQGWGITNYKENVIMSDGTNILHVLEPNFFTKLSEIEIYDDNGPLNQLNELENVDGSLFANVYLSNFIVEINLENGKVISKLDLSKLVPKEYKNENDLVLNGIAYNKENKHFYVTGKRWPVLYEIEIIR